MKVFDKTPITFVHKSKEIKCYVSGHAGRILQFNSTDPEFLKIQPSGYITFPHFLVEDPQIPSPWISFMNDLLNETGNVWENMPDIEP